MSTNRINIGAVNARAKEEQTPMTKILSVEEAILKMKEEIQQHGDMHGADCFVNMEDPDECECEELEFWGNQIAKYMRSVATAQRDAEREAGARVAALERYQAISKIMNNLLSSDVTRIARDIYNYRDRADSQIEALTPHTK